MRPIIREDILGTLQDVIRAIKDNDFVKLRELSNHTIHDASVFQEDDPLALAVLVYALSKVAQRCVEQGKSCPVVVPALERAREVLIQYDDDSYRSIIKNLLREIGDVDQQMKLYIQEVIENARIKKGSKIHQHGISIARTAEILGVSQWELQSYIGQQHEENHYDGVRIEDRIKFTRNMFQ
jgi:hypothetical protein